MSLTFPAYEINWFYGLNEKYKIPTAPNDGYRIFPADLAPPSLLAWLKKEHRETEYLNMGPEMGSPDGLYWTMWGWNSYPKSYDTPYDWRARFLAKNRDTN